MLIVLTLPKNCKGFFKTLQFIPNVTNGLVTCVNNIVSNFNILRDDCCVKSRITITLTEIPLSKISSIYLDLLQQASVHLEPFEQKINAI